MWDRPSLFVVCHPRKTMMASRRGLGDRRQKSIVCPTFDL